MGSDKRDSNRPILPEQTGASNLGRNVADKLEWSCHRVSILNINVDEEQHLLIANPTGVFDMKVAEEIVQLRWRFWEVKHQEGYDRLCNVTGLDAIHLSTAEIKGDHLCAEDSLT